MKGNESSSALVIVLHTINNFFLVPLALEKNTNNKSVNDNINLITRQILIQDLEVTLSELRKSEGSLPNAIQNKITRLL